MIDDDARLMLRFRDGDRDAFETLFRRYTPPLINFLARMVPDRARAEELAQEVFVRIYQARQRYEPKARFSTWLFGIARRLALNELDRAYRKRERPLDDTYAQFGADPAPSAEEQLDAERRGRAIERALARLPERQRAALLLRSSQGLGYEEIAAVLETSTASIKSLLHRARGNLLGLLKEEGM
jgi:RNA polymerase sigma-70 factor (ECF subfamily)